MALLYLKILLNQQSGNKIRTMSLHIYKIETKRQETLKCQESFNSRPKNPCIDEKSQLESESWNFVVISCPKLQHPSWKYSFVIFLRLYGYVYTVDPIYYTYTFGLVIFSVDRQCFADFSYQLIFNWFSFKTEHILSNTEFN